MKISVPLHITGFFKPCFNQNPFLSGSIGAGLVVKPGINCYFQFSKKENEIFFNGKKVKIGPIENLLKLFHLKEKISVKISSPVPLGMGYGASGATTLAVSLALCRSFNKSNLEAAKLAHWAEVKSLTGLGDVIAIFSGRDLAVRIKPGAPGIGLVKSFTQPKNLFVVTADLKKKSTKKMLKSMNPKIIDYGEKIFKKFIEKPNLKNFFQCSQLFSKKIKWGNEDFFKKLEPLKKQVFISSRNKEYCLGFSVKKGVLFTAVQQNKLKNVVFRLKKISSSIHIFKFGGGIEYER